jgi:hypothetical protein
MYNLFSCPALFDYLITINIYSFGNVHPNSRAMSHDTGHKTVKLTYCDIDKSRKTYLQNLHSDIHQPPADRSINYEHGKAIGESYNTQVGYVEKSNPQSFKWQMMILYTF